jgi:hypothetical protein
MVDMTQLESSENSVLHPNDLFNNQWNLYQKVLSNNYSSDFPETQETLDLIAQKHGFLRSESLYSDPLDTAKLLCFYA